MMELQQTATDALAAAAEALAFVDGAYTLRLRCERSVVIIFLPTPASGLKVCYGE
jgi:hypothetical protein